MDAIFAFIEVLDMKFDDLADGIIKHEEAGGLLDVVGWFGDVNKVENGG